VYVVSTGGDIYLFYSFNGDFHYRGSFRLGGVDSVMRLKKFSCCSWVIGLSLGLVIILLGFLCVAPIQVFLTSGFVMRIFCFDVVAFYLVLLSCLLWVSLLFWVGEMSRFSYLMIGISVVSSVFCYCCIHALWFWVFYEMSIVPLLVLLVIESPYSERYIAS